MNNHVFIIAEAGVNHNGRLDLALRLVDEAKNAGADCVKFQTYVTENDTVASCNKADYQQSTDGENQYEMLKKLELSFEDFYRLNKYCEHKNIMFLSTAFDIESFKFLNSINMPIWKIASSEVENYQLLKYIGSTGKPVIMSTGMCSMVEISKAVEVLKKHGTTDISLLHCNTEYPTPMEDANLLAMNEIKERFKCKVGYSDHTEGIEIPIAAVALGASIIEKHFTLDKNMEGPDHKVSLEPDELAAMVRSVRNVEMARGNGIKGISKSEIRNILAARKSLVARCDIKKGEMFTEENLIAKRPGGGVNPMKWETVIGHVAKQDYKKDEMINV